VPRFNRHSLTVVTAPAALPVSVADMQAYLVIGSQDAAMIEGFIVAAAGAMEQYLRASIGTQTLRLTMDGFSGGGDESLLRLGPGVHTGSYVHLTGGADRVDLPRGPVQSVTSITTYDRANASSVFDGANYRVDVAGDRVYLNEGRTWPDNLRATAAVEIVYVAGFNPLPPAIGQGLKQHVAAMYECRSACDMPRAAQSIVDSYRRFDELGWR
jgi:hypothetical protein